MEQWHYSDGPVALVGELYRPATPNGAAILVAHEADGIGGNVRRRCAMLAEAGFLAAACDLHGGGRVLDGEEMAAAVQLFRTAPERLRRRIGAALHALLALSGLAPARVAAIGYCFGGTAVLELARAGAAIAAVASFHGLLTTTAPARPGAVRARVLACTGARDPLVPPADVATFQAEMAAADADWQLVNYGRALHSFTNAQVDALGDPRMRHDPAADRQSWAALEAFLRESGLPGGAASGAPRRSGRDGGGTEPRAPS